MPQEAKKIGVGFGIMLFRDGKILLGRRNKDAEKASSALHGEGTWTMPGGKLHFFETFEDGAKREVAEETGIKVKSIDFISITNNIVSDAHFVTLGFFCTDFDGEAEVLEPDEIEEWQWFPLNKLPTPIYKPSEEVIRNYLEKVIYRG